MNKRIAKTTVIVAILLLAGCTGQGNQTTTTGILIKNELNTQTMQPGGSVRLRTSINNFFDNELTNANAKLVRSFGQLTVSGTGKLGTIQANPNATARTEWILSVKKTAASGTEFTNKVRMCFHYQQKAWHDLSLVNSFETESTITQGAETGPLLITWSGLDEPYIQNEQVKSQVPISISIKNNYEGYVGRMDLSRDEIANITHIEMIIYDENGGPGNTSPVDPTASWGSNIKEGTNLEIIKEFTNPSCDNGETLGCFQCDNSKWNDEEDYFNCTADEIPVFGDETFIGTKLNITQLNSEELIETIELTIDYDYCIESEEFTLTVFNPGGR